MARHTRTTKVNEGTPEDSPNTPEFLKLNGGRWVGGKWYWDPKYLKRIDKTLEDAGYVWSDVDERFIETGDRVRQTIKEAEEVSKPTLKAPTY